MDGTVMFKDRIGRRDPGPDSAAKGGAADRCSAVRALVMRRLIADVSAPVSDAAFRQRCGEACALGVYGVIVSPVRVALARKLCSAGGVRTVCLIGGSGESFLAVKRAEAAYAVRRGAQEIYFVPCRSALAEGHEGYLRREVKRVRRAVGRRPLIVKLDDPALTEEERLLGTRVAMAAGAAGVCVGGSLPCVLCAVRSAAGLRVDAREGNDAESARIFLRVGEGKLCTQNAAAVARMPLGDVPCGRSDAAPCPQPESSADDVLPGDAAAGGGGAPPADPSSDRPQ